MCGGDGEACSAVGHQRGDAAAVVGGVAVETVDVEVAVGGGAAAVGIVGELHADGVRAGAEVAGEAQILPGACAVQDGGILRGGDGLAVNAQRELGVAVVSVLGQVQRQCICRRRSDRDSSTNRETVRPVAHHGGGRIGIGRPV